MSGRALTCGVACLCAERQDFDIFVVGACSQQLSAVTPGHAVDGAFVVFVPLEANHRLLRWTGNTTEQRAAMSNIGLTAKNYEFLFFYYSFFLFLKTCLFYFIAQFKTKTINSVHFMSLLQ